MGIGIEQFWAMTWREYTIHVMADERNEVNEWHRVRSVVYMIYRMNTGDKIAKKPEQIMPLPGDRNEDRGQPMSDEEVLRSIKLFSNAGNA
jgi:hypothetical protein